MPLCVIVFGGTGFLSRRIVRHLHVAGLPRSGRFPPPRCGPFLASKFISVKLIQRTNKEETETWKDAAPAGRFATGWPVRRYSPTAVIAVGANAEPAPPAW